ncbi:glycosyltransferase family 2 protein [Winogradskyella forsetii]|uniref:glycosyltransferase family 2 protein n=1 Tax=Winogradskyella forsetii TaxID=2686077 RepID=UPI0015C04176|nr:glycosyltransferase [Winogradskyella forsetii]
MNNFFLVIPTRERLECLSNLLRDLNAFSSCISQVVIVDQSEPPVTEALNKIDLDYEYRVVIGDKNKSVNHSRNLALNYYKDEEWLFFLDDDLRISKLAFKKIIEHLAPNVIDVLIPGIFADDLEIKTVEYDSILDMIAKPKNFSKSRFRLQVSSGLNIVKAQTFKEAGFYFDEMYTIWGDDWDYGMRLLQAGAIIYYQPDILVEHLQVGTGGQRDKSKTLNIKLEKKKLYFYFIKKHFSKAVLKKEFYVSVIYGFKVLLKRANYNDVTNTIKAYRYIKRKN